MAHVDEYFKDAVSILNSIDKARVEEVISLLLEVRQNNGRLFFIGVGGSAANCSHAVNDFRKICGFQAYSPVDNIAELTARTNDEGWHTVFCEWLKDSGINERDGVFVFSVGGGSREKNISVNIVSALEFAKSKNAKIMGVVGRDGGYTARVADACVIVPPVNPKTITPHSEAFQGVIWHLIVSDPRLMRMGNKWETIVTEKGA